MPSLPRSLPFVFSSPLIPTVPVVPGVGVRGRYDVAVGGVRLLLKLDQQQQYVRESAQLRKQQIDTSDRPGEQSTDDWWKRWQDTYTGGAGRAFFESDETGSSWDSSFKVNPWKEGVLTRLPDTVRAITAVTSNQLVIAANTGSTECFLHSDGAVLRRVDVTAGDAAPAAAATLNYGASETILDLATDGTRYYVITTGGVYRGPCDGSSSGIKIYTATPSRGKLGWMKQRLVAAIDNKVYELDATVSTATALPTAKYTHPHPSWIWTSFAESPVSILASGYIGNNSTIYRFDLDTSGGFPALTAAKLAAAIPAGEVVYSLTTYLQAYAVLGTSKGVRVGTLDSDGSLAIGPLSIETHQPVLCSTGWDRFVYAGATLEHQEVPDGARESGVWRLDLSTTVDKAGRFPYASDVVPPAVTSGVVRAVAVAAGRTAFSVDGYGLVIAATSPGSARAGWLRTAKIRFSLVDPKVFRRGRIRATIAAAGEKVVVHGQGPFSSEQDLLTYDTVGSDPGEFPLVQGPLEWLRLRFELIGAGASLTSWLVKALPASPKPRMIQLPVLMFDTEIDRSGRVVQASARDRLALLEEADRNNDEVLFQDFTGSSTYQTTCLIESLSFRQIDPPQNMNGFGGVLLITLRTME